MIDTDKGAKYLLQVEKLLKKYPISPMAYSSNEFREKSMRGESPWQETQALEVEVKIDKKEAVEEAVETPSSFVNNILNMFRK